MKLPKTMDGRRVNCAICRKAGVRRTLGYGVFSVKGKRRAWRFIHPSCLDPGTAIKRSGVPRREVAKLADEEKTTLHRALDMLLDKRRRRA